MTNMPNDYGFLLPKCNSIIYRPQTKFAKVMFLRLSVSHSVHVGVPRQVPPQAGTPLRADTPSPGRYTSGLVPSGQVHPQAGTPPWQVHSPGRYPPGRYPPLPTTVHAGIRSTSGRYASYWNAFLYYYNPQKLSTSRKMMSKKII